MYVHWSLISTSDPYAGSIAGILFFFGNFYFGINIGSGKIILTCMACPSNTIKSVDIDMVIDRLAKKFLPRYSFTHL